MQAKFSEIFIFIFIFFSYTRIPHGLRFLSSTFLYFLIYSFVMMRYIIFLGLGNWSTQGKHAFEYQSKQVISAEIEKLIFLEII